MAFLRSIWLNCAASRLHASHTTHDVLTDTAYETTGVSELVFLIFFSVQMTSHSRVRTHCG